MGSISCVMYHYIKKNNDLFFKNFNKINRKIFKEQINFFEKKFTFLSPDEAKYLIDKKNINKQFCWLTFDDGYIEHYEFVLDFLNKKKIKASFFPSLVSLQNIDFLMPNKIHILLSKSNSDYLLHLYENIFLSLSLDEKYGDLKKLKKRLVIKSRFDNYKTSLFKKLCQSTLEDKDSEIIINKMIKIFRVNEKKLLKKFYFNLKNCIEIYNDGHEIGMHSFTHPRFSNINYNKQKKEITENIKYLKKKKIFRENLSFCYPYGSFNSDTIKILKKNDINFALTTKKGRIFNNVDKLKIPRIDTTDFFNE